MGLKDRLLTYQWRSPTGLGRQEYWLEGLRDNAIEQKILNCSLSHVTGYVKSVAGTINSLAGQFEDAAETASKADKAGGYLNVVGGVLGLAGLSIMPFCLPIAGFCLTVAGAETAALWLTGGAAVTGIGGGLSKLYGSYAASAICPERLKRTKEEHRQAEEYIQVLTVYLLQIFDASPTGRFLPTCTADEEDCFLKLIRMIDEITAPGVNIGSMNIIRPGSTAASIKLLLQSGYRTLSSMNRIREITDSLRGVSSASVEQVLAPGLNIRDMALIPAGSANAFTLSRIIAKLGIAMGIWDIIEGNRRMESRSQVVMEIRRAADGLEKRVDICVGFCNLLRELARYHQIYSLTRT